MYFGKQLRAFSYKHRNPAETKLKPSQNRNRNQIALFCFRQTFHIWTKSAVEI